MGDTPIFPPKGVARGFKSALKYVYYYVGQIHLVYIHTVHVYIDVYRSETRYCEVTTDHSINTEQHLVKQTAELGTSGVTLGDSKRRYTWTHSEDF
jgi:hypothetical protein